MSFQLPARLVALATALGLAGCQTAPPTEPSPTREPASADDKASDSDASTSEANTDAEDADASSASESGAGQPTTRAEPPPDSDPTPIEAPDTDVAGPSRSDKGVGDSSQGEPVEVDITETEPAN